MNTQKKKSDFKPFNWLYLSIKFLSVGYLIGQKENSCFEL